jgi:hypothetical protein
MPCLSMPNKPLKRDYTNASITIRKSAYRSFSMGKSLTVMAMYDHLRLSWGLS